MTRACAIRNVSRRIARVDWGKAEASLDERGFAFAGPLLSARERFPNAQRPVRGARDVYRVQTRHGVSEVRRGVRETLGIIFYDAA